MKKFAVIVFAGILLGGCATYSATSGRVAIKDDTAVAGVRIGDGDRAVIRNYYANRKGSAAAGGSVLPKPVIGGKLSPAVQAQRLPLELETQLARLPVPYVRVRAGQDIVLMDRNTYVILDVVYDIGR